MVYDPATWGFLPGVGPWLAVSYCTSFCGLGWCRISECENPRSQSETHATHVAFKTTELIFSIPFLTGPETTGLYFLILFLFLLA